MRESLSKQLLPLPLLAEQEACQDLFADARGVLFGCCRGAGLSWVRPRVMQDQEWEGPGQAGEGDNGVLIGGQQRGLCDPVQGKASHSCVPTFETTRDTGERRCA